MVEKIYEGMDRWWRGKRGRGKGRVVGGTGFSYLCWFSHLLSDDFPLVGFVFFYRIQEQLALG